MTDQIELPFRKVHAYCRVSTAEQSSRGYSLEEQERQCRRTALARHPNHEFVLWSEPGVTAGVPLAKRKVGARMVAALRAGDVLIASKLDRVFRNLIDALTQIEEFAARQITCIMLDIGAEPINRTGAGKLHFQMLSALAEFERNRISERVRDSYNARRANNVNISSGRPPFGFAFEADGYKKRLIPDPREQEILDAMRRLHREGYPYVAVARHLTGAGYRSRAGTAISNGSVRHLLIKQNLAPQRLDRKTVRLRQRRGIDDALRDWAVVEGWLAPLKPAQLEQRQRRAEADRALLRVINRIQASRITTYRGIAAKLTAAHIPTRTGRGHEWGGPAVRKIMLRLGITSSRRPHRQQMLQLGCSSPITDPAIIVLIRTDRRVALAEMRRLRAGGASWQAIALQMRKYGCPTCRSAAGVRNALKRFDRDGEC
jgi:putative DNA-invertase from lambdoid prophage Rac